METELIMRAALSPSTFNKDARTIEAVISTGADVNRGAYIERLSLDGVGGNVDRLISKIVQLRGEMARAAAEQARLNLQNLEKERSAAEKLVGQRQRDLGRTNTTFLANSPEFSARGRATIAALRNGTATSADIEALRPELQRFIRKNPNNGV